MRTPITCLTLTFALLAAAPSRAAEADWFASLYTGEGIELRADERVFTLYAVLNAMGYDEGPVTRKYPLPKVAFHPVRVQVRAKLLSADPEVRRLADAYFDSHPQPIGRYLAYALASAPPPFPSGAKAKDLADLKGLEGLLSKAHGAWKLDELMGQVQGEYRKALKGYLTAIDAPVVKARKLLKVPANGPESLLVVNLLEAQDDVKGVMADNEVVLVVGPSDKPDVEGLVREYGRVFLEPQLGKKTREWAGGAGLLKEAQALGAGEQTAGEYATALFTRALALRALDAPDAAYDAAGQKGYFGLKEIAKGFDDARPVDAWALEALARAETRRPAAKK
ncbi:MAG: hypothetical protein ACYC8T_31305 [Myxococcaceae bacterium]